MYIIKTYRYAANALYVIEQLKKKGIHSFLTEDKDNKTFKGLIPEDKRDSIK